MHHPVKEKNKKLRIAVYHTMVGKCFFTACKAFQHAETIHNGMRKDGVSTEFSHQIWIASFILTLSLDSSFMEKLLIAVFYHDTCEDKDMSREELAKLYGEDIANIIWCLTKEWRGHKLTSEEYFNRLMSCIEAILVKAVDRIHNLKTMIGVFSKEKMLNYCKETREIHIPMLKQARHCYPEYTMLLHNLESILIIQVDTVEGLLS